MSEPIPQEPIVKPKRKYTKRNAPEPPSARELLKEIVSEIKASQEEPLPTIPKKKKVLSDKQKECLAKGRELRLAKLKSVSAEK
jgi:hypothetical protein